MQINLLIIYLLILFQREDPTCICTPKSTEQAFSEADLVIKGRIIDCDTLLVRQLPSRKELNGSKEYDSYNKFIGVKVIIQRNFKKGQTLQDTVFILTDLNSDCSYPFTPNIYRLSSSFYVFIFFANRAPFMQTHWIEYKVMEKDGQELNFENIFFTSSCHKTRPVTPSFEAEIEQVSSHN
ncbi:MAG TPA: hypothetical protein VNS32_12985 [Flavisolibacter sp.]|nr:hypothetical protein [Flavisolibacter sp.]